ncbi:30S ribosomal protein S9 [Bacteriovorax stolpii]|uniref:Small ribosomal subunit protein uS9 n=1 Tax=Bacteriovorax stolpii TaxID=960 RepID=A0A2K9NMB5_BACTC|nr:30S ribosomal protein S9 [Bacteriovorax stolpii]AUN96656.1 30S ribosomal protein S9 [Bacteriovorax stolpii]QDK43412.1 30S ribosomal protein S9 [Bacteriovorax stolpii]TDP53823.1 SSU ribosomal protein S9P [Bacteriovorax stolpii]BDT26679.1 30S ribosomal protein S9 [Bacteriovorax sp. HI3]
MAAKGKTYDTHAIGRRKTAVARVYMANGSGKITINKRDVRNFFKQETNLYVVNQPLNLVKLAEKFDFVINVAGGGISGQAGAIRLAISRALIKVQPGLRSELKAAGFLTRDPRAVERKKAGRAGARKRYQFSKR